MKLSDIKKAQKNIQEFCDQFTSVITITNQKGMWTARVTRKSVQVFIVTGDSLFDCIMKADERCTQKRSTLGI